MTPTVLPLINVRALYRKKSANFCPIISRHSIIKSSTSLNDIWQKIRLHFGFQSSGSHFLDLSQIKQLPDERPEDLFQPLTAFFEDNLVTTSGGILHHGKAIPSDEDLTPTIEDAIVFPWLQLIYPGLPQFVKKRYGAKLRNNSLASIKPEISQALESLLDDLRSIAITSKKRSFKSCIFCKTAGCTGSSSHGLVDGKYLTEYKKRSLARSRLVCDNIDDQGPYTGDEGHGQETIPQDLTVNDPLRQSLSPSSEYHSVAIFKRIL